MTKKIDSEAMKNFINILLFAIMIAPKLSSRSAHQDCPDAQDPIEVAFPVQGVLDRSFVQPEVK